MPRRQRVPEIRVRQLNDAPIARDGDFVLYWMTAFRRVHWNFSLQRAVEWSEELRRPLLVLEALRCGYEWASDRLHHFVIQGMADNERELGERRVGYYAYLEPQPGAGRGLLQDLASRACIVVSDDFPCFFLPRMMQAVAPRLPVRMELVDSNGLLPLRAANRVFPVAHAFRRFLQKSLVPHLEEQPAADPLRGCRIPPWESSPSKTVSRWPPSPVAALADDPSSLKKWPIDHSVTPAPIRGGSQTAMRQLQMFVRQQLAEYDVQRNHPDADAASGLSPYLHFGHISAHQVFSQTMQQDDWTIDQVADKASGSREGWWGASPAVEAFLDELITWRELGYNRCWQDEHYDQFETLPDWAQQTLNEHLRDRREYEYDLQEFSQADTHDPLWNAAQRQLRHEGRIHNYLRMLWGKKILEWTPTPREALRIMIELNNRYALDGAIPTLTAASSGCWDATIGPGDPSGRFLARCGICPPRTPRGKCA